MAKWKGKSDGSFTNSIFEGESSWNHSGHRKIRLIEDIVKCRHLKKFTRKGTILLTAASSSILFSAQPHRTKS
jgi:hypothetical protein